MARAFYPEYEQSFLQNYIWRYTEKEKQDNLTFAMGLADELVANNKKIVSSDFDGTILRFHSFYDSRVTDLFRGDDFIGSQEEARALFADPDLFEKMLIQFKERNILFAIASKQNYTKVYNLIKSAFGDKFIKDYITAGIHATRNHLLQDDESHKRVLEKKYNGGAKGDFNEELAISGFDPSVCVYWDDAEAQLTEERNQAQYNKLVRLSNRGLTLYGGEGQIPPLLAHNARYSNPLVNGINKENLRGFRQMLARGHFVIYREVPSLTRPMPAYSPTQESSFGSQQVPLVPPRTYTPSASGRSASSPHTPAYFASPSPATSSDSQSNTKRQPIPLPRFKAAEADNEKDLQDDRLRKVIRPLYRLFEATPGNSPIKDILGKALSNPFLSDENIHTLFNDLSEELKNYNDREYARSNSTPPRRATFSERISQFVKRPSSASPAAARFSVSDSLPCSIIDLIDKISSGTQIKLTDKTAATIASRLSVYMAYINSASTESSTNDVDIMSALFKSCSSLNRDDFVFNRFMNEICDYAKSKINNIETFAESKYNNTAQALKKLRDFADLAQRFDPSIQIMLEKVILSKIHSASSDKRSSAATKEIFESTLPPRAASSENVRPRATTAWMDPRSSSAPALSGGSDRTMQLGHIHPADEGDQLETRVTKGDQLKTRVTILSGSRRSSAQRLQDYSGKGGSSIA